MIVQANRAPIRIRYAHCSLKLIIPYWPSPNTVTVLYAGTYTRPFASIAVRNELPAFVLDHDPAFAANNGAPRVLAS